MTAPPVESVLTSARAAIDAGRCDEAEHMLQAPLTAGVAGGTAFRLLCTCAGLEAARGRGFRALRLAGAAACQRDQSGTTDRDLQQWMTALVQRASDRMSDDSASTEWLWGHRMGLEGALQFALSATTGEPARE